MTIAPLLNERRRAGPNTFRAETLPFRTIKNELHFVLPLNSQFAEIQGLLTVSGARRPPGCAGGGAAAAGAAGEPGRGGARQ